MPYIYMVRQNAVKTAQFSLGKQQHARERINVPSAPMIYAQSRMTMNEYNSLRDCGKSRVSCVEQQQQHRLLFFDTMLERKREKEREHKPTQSTKLIIITGATRILYYRSPWRKCIHHSITWSIHCQLQLSSTADTNNNIFLTGRYCVGYMYHFWPPLVHFWTSFSKE